MYKQFNFQSSDASNSIFANVYYPKDSSPIGIIQIVHGMAEHIGRYEDFAKYFCERSYIVCASDHVGHGRSVKNEQDYGYFGTTDGGEIMVDDVRKLFEILINEYPDLPYFILGHSMGSFVLRKYITKYPDGLSGIIISGTGGSNPLAKIGIKLAKRDLRKNGDRNRSKFIDNLAFGNYNKKIPNARTKFDWLTRDESIVDKYIEDDACGYIFTSSGFVSLLNIMYEVNLKGWADNVSEDLPIMFISGSDDPVGNYKKGVQYVYDMLKLSGVKDIKLLFYDNGRHEILNELNRAEVYTDIENWINKHI